MRDIIFIFTTMGFFALAAAYTCASQWLLAFEETSMLLDYLVSGAASIAIGIYLVYALLRPERF
jgi:K+-transporting ATPase KdpF subunit